MIKSFSLLFFAILIFGCGSSKNVPNDRTTWDHFKIEAKTSDNPVFARIQKTIGIEPPMATFVICVNISDKDKTIHRFTMGDENDPKAYVYQWSVLKKEDQDILLNWTGNNKFYLGKKK